jgi:hypothetical protein
MSFIVALDSKAHMFSSVIHINISSAYRLKIFFHLSFSPSANHYICETIELESLKDGVNKKEMGTGNKTGNIVNVNFDVETVKKSSHDLVPEKKV